MESNKTFIFYESFENAINQMSDEQALKAYKAIVKYGLHEELPAFETDLVLSVLFSVVKPLIDMAKTRRTNGKKGGRPSNKECYPRTENDLPFGLG